MENNPYQQGDNDNDHSAAGTTAGLVRSCSAMFVISVALIVGGVTWLATEIF